MFHRFRLLFFLVSTAPSTAKLVYFSPSIMDADEDSFALGYQPKTSGGVLKMAQDALKSAEESAHRAKNARLQLAEAQKFLRAAEDNVEDAEAAANSAWEHAKALTKEAQRLDRLASQAKPPKRPRLRSRQRSESEPSSRKRARSSSSEKQAKSCSRPRSSSRHAARSSDYSDSSGPEAHCDEPAPVPVKVEETAQEAPALEAASSSGPALVQTEPEAASVPVAAPSPAPDPATEPKAELTAAPAATSPAAEPKAAPAARTLPASREGPKVKAAGPAAKPSRKTEGKGAAGLEATGKGSGAGQAALGKGQEKGKGQDKGKGPGKPAPAKLVNGRFREPSYCESPGHKPGFKLWLGDLPKEFTKAQAKQWVMDTHAEWGMTMPHDVHVPSDRPPSGTCQVCLAYENREDCVKAQRCLDRWTHNGPDVVFTVDAAFGGPEGKRAK